MKKNLYTLIVCLTATVAFSSCSDWFDVSPKTNVKAEELFETENGFQSALAGIYISMTSGNVYGGNLSFGMLDQMAQLYDMLPNGATDRTEVYIYDLSKAGYNTKGRLENVWGNSYYLIANANNLMKWLDLNGERVIPNEDVRNMMYGEALAIRAYIHFDLLRCWGPMDYAESKETLCIPYRVVADNSRQPLLSAEKVTENILADLVKAEQYLSFEKGISLKDNERRCRFNYHAVKALMARVYNYMGDKENAFQCADQVIKNCGLTLQISNAEDPVLYSEAICAVNVYKMAEEFTSAFAEGPDFTTQYYTGLDTYRILFQASGSESDSDMRAKTTAVLRYNDVRKVISRKYIKNDNAVIPLIRLPEMYYIQCAASDLSDAPQYINAVRNKRGYSSSEAYQTFRDEDARVNALNLEYRKEFYAEGQYFYFLKSHGYTTLDYCPAVELGEKEYVFPLPDAEREYGWTSENEEVTGDGE